MDWLAPSAKQTFKCYNNLYGYGGGKEKNTNRIWIRCATL